MSTGGSNLAIIAAILANILIAISKFIAAFFTRSSAMLSEGIHSLVDIFNGLLLLYGIKKSKKRPTKLHPFGYGMETYFWSFVVSILVFSVGGGVAIYEGIHRLIHPSFESDNSHIIWNYVVLITAIFFEGTSLIIGIKQFKKDHPKGMRNAIKESKDSATVAVLIEESAATIGNFIALGGVTLSFVTKDPFFDALASILIGILLVYIAYFMASETKHLLLGEAATDEDIKKIRDLFDSYGEIEYSGNIRTMHLGPMDILLAAEVNFRDDLSTPEIELLVKKIKDTLQKENHKLKYIYIESSMIEKSIF